MTAAGLRRRIAAGWILRFVPRKNFWLAGLWYDSWWLIPPSGKWFAMKHNVITQIEHLRAMYPDFDSYYKQMTGGSE